MFIFVTILVVSLVILAKILIYDPYISEKNMDQIKQIYYNENTQTSPSTNNSSEDNKFSELLAVNKDICGWISIENTKIDYPVLQASEDDPEYYLHHNYKKESTKYGSIFLDPICNLKNNPQNTIIYGHHMADGQMFADLMKFSDIEFYKKSPIISYDTLREKGKWKIISVFKTNTLPEQGKVFIYMVSKFKNDDSFFEYIEEIKKRSLLNIPVDIQNDDKLITLSTCSSEFEGFRTVIVARKIRSGESEKVDVNFVTKSENPLMPDCWYKKYGGKPPV